MGKVLAMLKGGTQICGVVFTQYLGVLAILKGGGGAGGVQKVPPFKGGGGGRKKFYPVLKF